MNDSETKKWSVMVYLAGDNNLSDEMVTALKQMNRFCKKWGNVIKVDAYLDPFGNYPRKFTFDQSSKAVFERAGDPIDEHDLNKHRKLAIAREILLKAKSNPVNPDLQKTITEVDISEEMAKGPSTMTEGKILNILVGQGRVGATLDDLPGEVKIKFKRWLKGGGEVLLRGATTAAQLQNFVIELIGKFSETDHSVIVLSGHGSGTIGDFLPDEDPQSSLSIPATNTFLELVKIARLGNRVSNTKPTGGPEINILGMDSCLMGMIEVCYEVRKHAEILVGSEGFVPSTGWPYHCALEALKNSATPREAAEGIVKGYQKFYRDHEVAGTSTQLSAICLSKMDVLAEAVGNLSEELTNHLERLGDFEELSELSLVSGGLVLEYELSEFLAATGGGGTRTQQNLDRARTLRNALILAHWYCQSYKRENYVDLWDFCIQLERFLNGGSRWEKEIRNLCAAVRTGVDDAVILCGTTGPEFQHSHGLAIYFPWAASAFAPEYENLAFNGGTGRENSTTWADFLREYLRTTRRVRRGQEERIAGDERLIKALKIIIRDRGSAKVLEELLIEKMHTIVQLLGTEVRKFDKQLEDGSLIGLIKDNLEALRAVVSWYIERQLADSDERWETLKELIEHLELNEFVFERDFLAPDALDSNRWVPFDYVRLQPGQHLLVREGGPYSGKEGGPYSGKEGGPYSGKGLCRPVKVKNPPDGFYRLEAEGRGCLESTREGSTENTETE